MQVRRIHRLIQFLLGLNETFSVVRSNMLMRQPLPYLSVAYSVLLQEQSHRVLNGSISDDLVDSSTTLMSNRNIVHRTGSTVNRFKARVDKTNWVCSYCGNKGHKINTCWKKYGVLDTMKKRWVANAYMSDDVDKDCATDPLQVSMDHNLTRNQPQSSQIQTPSQSP